MEALKEKILSLMKDNESESAESSFEEGYLLGKQSAYENILNLINEKEN